MIQSIPSTTLAADLIATLNDRLRQINLAIAQAATGKSTTTTVTKVIGGGVVQSGGSGSVQYGTHNARLQTPAASVEDGAIWYETDRTVWYQFEAGAWHWIDGTYSCTQANLPTDLKANDNGFLALVTDYNHVLQWNGSTPGWQAGPNWDSPGYIRGFMLDPSPATGWKLCDGNGDDGSPISSSHPVSYLKPNGTLGTITSATMAPCIPNLAGSASFLQFGSPATGINAAVAPSLSMNSYTPQGTVSQPTFTGSAMATHQHEIPIYFSGANLYQLASYGTGSLKTISSYATGTTYSASGAAQLDQAVSAGTPFGTVSQPTFSGTLATLTGTVSQPTFSGTLATLTGTVSATGTPQGITLRPFFRK